jgi:hypothetical protein
MRRSWAIRRILKRNICIDPSLVSYDIIRLFSLLRATFQPSECGRRPPDGDSQDGPQFRVAARSGPSTFSPSGGMNALSSESGRPSPAGDRAVCCSAVAARRAPLTLESRSTYQPLTVASNPGCQGWQPLVSLSSESCFIPRVASERPADLTDLAGQYKSKSRESRRRCFRRRAHTRAEDE